MSALRTGVIFAAAIGAVASGEVAQAQSMALKGAQAASTDMFARDRGVAVRERPHPEYEARGLPVGAFTLYPRLQANAEYIDNVYATTTDAVDDVVWRVKPELALESGWSRHSLQTYVRGTINRYQDFTTEDSEEWGVGASGRLDVMRQANLTGGLSYASQTESRTASNTAVSAAEPIQFDTTEAFLAGTRAAGRLKLSARADYRQLDYQDGQTVGGATIDQSNRNRKISSLSGRVDYALSPATAVFFQATANKRDYEVDDGPIPSRDSTGYEAVAGVNFELGAVSRGEVAAGYLKQEYDNVAYNNIDGFGARARFEWFPTELTTVTLNGSRTVEDAGILGSSGYLSSGIGATVDHELFRNVILTANTTFNSDDYNGVDRKDERFGAAIGGTYLLNRNLGVSLTASHLKQSSKGANNGANFDVNRLMVSLVSQF
jgi:hypothetical protein